MNWTSFHIRIVKWFRQGKEISESFVKLSRNFRRERLSAL